MEISTGFLAKSVICSVDGCEKPVDCKGLCNSHYQRWNKYGRLETAVWGQSEHPLYNLWNERKNKNLLCDEWLDFKKFLSGVGDRPDDCKLWRLDKSKPFGPDNFVWKKNFSYLEGETKSQYLSRRRKENLHIYKNRELLDNFGITLNEYNDKLEKQKFVCAICEEPEKVIHHINNRVKSLAVDHCHKTGKIRGLLCQRCNRVLGKLKDSLDLLDKMKAYLNAYS